MMEIFAKAKEHFQHSPTHTNKLDQRSDLPKTPVHDQ